jgi:uncharacterized protein YgiM (DUF1202 family)
MAETKKRTRRSKKSEEVIIENSAAETIQNVEPIEKKPDTFSGLVITKKDYLNVRKAPNGDKIGKLDKGTKHKFIDQDFGGWYKLSDGKGYVKAEFIKKM